MQKRQWMPVRERVLQGLVGTKAWGAQLGHGSFITIEFGDPAPADEKGRIYGEWHLWVYCAHWTADLAGECVSSDDDRQILQSWVANLNGRRLEAFDTRFESSDVVLMFEGGLRLVVRPAEAVEPDDEIWMLFMPDGVVLSKENGGAWTLERGDARQDSDG